MSKRKLAAGALRLTGALRALETLRSKPGILIVTHHRVGDAASSRFDRGIFSASADSLDRQLKYFKRHLNIIGGEELEAIVTGQQKLTRMHVAITFDDGYLNDYTTSFDVLKSNGCTGSFFLVPEYVGTATIPWWDEIAYLVRNTRNPSITLTYPVPLTLLLTADRESAIRTVLHHYKLPENHDGQRLLDELREQTACDLPAVSRRFINWEEAREMKAAGMTIGSHTQSHRILGQISPEERHWELAQSKQAIEHQIGAPVTSIAYPVGIRSAFDAHTERITRELGYSVGFSFYGGVNTPQHMQSTNLLRIATNPDWMLFRAETAFLTRLGWLPY